MDLGQLLRRQEFDSSEALDPEMTLAVVSWGLAGIQNESSKATFGKAVLRSGTVTIDHNN